MTRASVTSMAQSFAQIAYQGPCHAIGRDHAADNAVFIPMRDPSDKPDIAVDRLQVDAGDKNVRNHQRFGQWGVFFISHRSSQFSNTFTQIERKTGEAAQ
jgi:hypothetical protein